MQNAEVGRWCVEVDDEFGDNTLWAQRPSAGTCRGIGLRDDADLRDLAAAIQQAIGTPDTLAALIRRNPQAREELRAALVEALELGYANGKPRAYRDGAIPDASGVAEKLLARIEAEDGGA